MDWSAPDGARLVTLAWVIVLGLLATLPIGAILGSLIVSARDIVPADAAADGPDRHLRHLLPDHRAARLAAGLAQVFPMYWLGLGMRSALLPDEAAAVEIGGSWRHLETAGGARRLGGRRVGARADRAAPNGPP